MLGEPPLRHHRLQLRGPGAVVEVGLAGAAALGVLEAEDAGELAVEARHGVLEGAGALGHRVEVGPVADLGVVDAEDGGAVLAAVGLPRGHDPLLRRQLRQRPVHGPHRVLVAVEEGGEQLPRLPRVLEELPGVGAVAAEAGADVDALHLALPGAAGVVQEAALAEALHEGAAVVGGKGAAQQEGGDLAPRQGIEGAGEAAADLAGRALRRGPGHGRHEGSPSCQSGCSSISSAACAKKG